MKLNEDDSVRRFIARLCDEGLTARMMRTLLLASEEQKPFHFMVEDMGVYYEHARPYVLEEADLAGMS